jgi:hypothetical protein
MSDFTLSSPGRPIEAGCILIGVTEILDVAPLDMLGCIGKEFAEIGQLSEELRAKCPDVNFHWITEKGENAKMTGGMTIVATVNTHVATCDANN